MDTIFKLVKIDQDKEWQLYFHYIEQLNPDWKKSYKLSCFIYNKIEIKQGALSDYEFFRKIHQNESNKYLLLVNESPVTLISLFKRNEQMIDISFSTAFKHQNKGYATQAVKMIEEIIFKNLGALSITIIDMNPYHYSAKIAENLGYNYEKMGGFYIKENPYLKKLL